MRTRNTQGKDKSAKMLDISAAQRKSPAVKHGAVSPTSSDKQEGNYRQGRNSAFLESSWQEYLKKIKSKIINAGTSTRRGAGVTSQLSAHFDRWPFTAGEGQAASREVENCNSSQMFRHVQRHGGMGVCVCVTSLYTHTFTCRTRIIGVQAKEQR